MKRIATALCALAVVMAGSIPALAAEVALRQDASYYPISVEEYTYGELEEPRINKVYQLALSDDPSLIPTEDFERDGCWFTLLDMTRKNEVGVDTQPYTETVTRPSKTNDMAQVLQALEAEMEVTTADGYAGTLRLDHTSVQVKTDGYATKTNSLSATRSYPNLSDADVSLVPKSIEDKGKTLTLADVQWSEEQYADGVGGTVTRYTATASYTGTSTSRYATGYTVTANYTGEVAKTGCDMVTYPAILDGETFHCVQSCIREKTAKQTPKAERPALKLVSRLRCSACGAALQRMGGPNRRSDTLYLKCVQCGTVITLRDEALLDEIARQTAEQERPERTSYQPSGEVVRLTNAINRGLERPDDPQEVVSLILQGAAARYACCPDITEQNDRPLNMCLDHIRLAVSHINLSEEGTVEAVFPSGHRERTEHGADCTAAGADHPRQEGHGYPAAGEKETPEGCGLLPGIHRQ